MIGLVAVLMGVSATLQQASGAVAQPSAWALQGKLAVASEDPQAATAALRELRAAGPEGRLRAAVLVAETAGVESAQEQLVELGKLDDEQQNTRDRLVALFGESNDEWIERASELPAEDRRVLVQRLGWFGELALAPPGSKTSERERLEDEAGTAIAALFTALGGGVGGACIGVLLWIVVGAALLTGTLTAHLSVDERPGAVFIETFAVWLVLFVAVARGVRALETGLPPLALAGAASLGSLLALGWLPFRGLSWSEARRELGLHTGRGVLRELGWGLLGYFGLLPLLAIGVGLTALLTLVLTHLTGSPPGGAHPIAEHLADAGPAKLALIFTLAAVVAPLVEEITFRGALYLHLRKATRSLPRVVSALAAGLASGLVFAVVHPQGVVAVPVLTLMGLAFSIARELRGSLIAPMVMHGLSNGLVLALATSMLG